MARIRSIKPEFWSDAAVSECSPSARLLFIGTWSFADDHGSLARSAKQLKAQVFPHDNLDCEPLLKELLDAGLLVEYQAGGKKYLHIKNFSKHQKIDRPSQPRVPLYDESASNPTSNGEDSASAHRALGTRARVLREEKNEEVSAHIAPDPRTKNQERGLGEGSRAETTEAEWRKEAAEAMDRIQATYPTGIHASNWTVALHHANCLVSDGFATWAELVSVTERYRAYFSAPGLEHGAMNIGAHNFFDPRKKYWSQPWTITTAADMRKQSNIDAAAKAEEAIFGGLPE